MTDIMSNRKNTTGQDATIDGETIDFVISMWYAAPPTNSIILSFDSDCMKTIRLYLLHIGY